MVPIYLEANESFVLLGRGGPPRPRLDRRVAAWKSWDRAIMCEADLVRRARNGEEAAWHEVVDRYGAYLYRLAFSLVGNAAEAEDVLQETFAGALRHLPDFEGRSSVKTWLSRILVRQAARSYRARNGARGAGVGSGMQKGGRGRGDAPLRGVGGASPSPPQNRSDVRMDVLAALKALSPDHREVVVLRELQGMSYEEIAEVLGVPRGTVESRLFRARQILKEELKDYLP